MCKKIHSLRVRIILLAIISEKKQQQRVCVCVCACVRACVRGGGGGTVKREIPLFAMLTMTAMNEGG